MSNLASMRKLGPRNSLAKPTKTKKHKQIPPIKVVYISNPMRVKTSASQFRALVQQLTGQDSEIPADPTVYEDGDADKAVGNIQQRCDQQPPTVTTSSSEVEERGGGGCYYGGDELLMGHDQMVDNLLPVWGSEAFVCTWMC